MRIMRYTEVNLPKRVSWGKKSNYNWYKYLLQCQKEKRRMPSVIYIRDTMG